MTPAEALLAAILAPVGGASGLPRGRRRPKVSRAPRYPAHLESQYRARLVRLASEVAREVAEALAPLLARAREAEAAEAATRTDALLDLEAFLEIFARIRISVLRRVSDRKIISLLDLLSGRLSDWHAADLSEVLTLPISGDSPEVQTMLSGWRERNVALIKSVAEDLLGEVEGLVTQAVERGTRVEVLARRLERRFQVSRSRAKLIARDQVAKANAQLTEIRHKEAGITRYRWSSSQDERVRASHRRLNRTIHSWDSPPEVAPGRHEHPGMDYQCRCVAIPILDD